MDHIANDVSTNCVVVSKHHLAGVDGDLPVNRWMLRPRLRREATRSATDDPNQLSQCQAQHPVRLNLLGGLTAAKLNRLTCVTEHGAHGNGIVNGIVMPRHTRPPLPPIT
jgi:hypothetical protein